MLVRELMTTEPLCCTPDTSLADAARMMVDRDCGALPVVGDLVGRKPLGMITDRDIVTRALAANRDPLGMTVRDCMTSPAVTILEDARVNECLELLELSQIRRVIVVDASDACSGIVSQADVALHASKRETARLVHEVSKRSEPAFVS
jgi:CBS domain-containing protein